MDEFEFDKTRKAIGIHKIDEEEKKKLLMKFQQKGGQILKEKVIKKVEESPTSKKQQKQFSPLTRDPKLPSQTLKEEKLKEAEQIAKEKVQKEEILKHASSAFSIFSLKINLWLKGITYFNSEIVKPSFLSILNLEFKKSILECNILTTEFLSDSKFFENFKKQFYPFQLELLKRIYLFYDKNQLANLTSGFSESREGVPLDLLRVPIFDFIRKFYVIQPFRETALKLLLDCIDLQKMIQNKPEHIYKSKKKRIEEAWNYLMDKIYPKFILIAQYLERKKIEPNTELFEEMINISYDDKINPQRIQSFNDVHLESILKVHDKTSTTSTIDEKNIQKQENQQQTTENVNEEPKNQEEDQKEKTYQKIYNFGLRFLNFYSLEKLKKIYDPKDEFRNLPLKDKLFILYLYLNFFDDQFGFIFSTNKIRINTYIKDGQKINLKDDMNLIYENFRKIYEYFRKYYSDYIEYYNYKNDVYLNKNSIEYQKRLDYYEQRRIKTGRETYKLILNFVKKCEQILLILFKDIREKKQYISNPEDIIQLEYDETKLKLMNKKMIQEVIRDAYATIFSIAYKMERGELHVGDLELSDEEFNLHYSSII